MGIFHDHDDDCDQIGESCCGGNRCVGSLTCINGRCANPPPPPCPIQAQGCYKLGDNPAAAGTIIPTEYGYYLPENKCFRTGEPPSPTDPTSTGSPGTDPCGNGQEDPEEECGEPGLDYCDPEIERCRRCRCVEVRIPGSAAVVADITGYATSQNCICRNSKENVDPVNDPDNSDSACGCVKNTEYDGKVKCCGNEEEDCGNIVGESLCSMGLNIEGQPEDGSRIVDASSNIGDTVYVPCQGTLYLSDGSTWYKCDEDGFFKGGDPYEEKKILKAGQHEYLCMGFGRRSVVECCGDGQCQAEDNDVKKLVTGNPINPTVFTPEPRPSFSIESYINGGNTKDRPPDLRPMPDNRQACTTPIGSCDAPAGQIQYEDDVRSAISIYISSNSQIASARNNDFNVVNTYLNGVAAVLRGSGFEAGRTKNCNDNEAADAIIVRKPGDEYAEYYGIVINIGSGRMISDTANIGHIEKANWNRALPQNSAYGNNMIYYCRSDGSFSINLDAPGLNSQNNAKPADINKKPCEDAGATWIGAKCCGEPGSCEFHNNDGETNSCWNSTIKPSISLFEKNAVILYGGNFHGCAIGVTNYFPDNNVLLDVIDKGTNNELVIDHEYCFNEPEKNYFCSYNETWQSTRGLDKTRLSFAPQLDPDQAAECCAATEECWNGTSCIGSQHAKPLAKPLNNKRCIHGDWKNAYLKFTPDGLASGYCEEESQCLLNPLAESDQCVNSGFYDKDNYCDNGNWSTRTRLIVLKMLKMKTSNYVLFCDDKQNTLNNLQYLIGSNQLASDVVAGLQANNFCVLKNTDKVVLAASFNKPFEEVPGVYGLFGVNHCNAAQDDGNYYSCSDSNKIWYNKKLKTFIYSPSGIIIPPEQEKSSFIVGLVRGIIDSIKRLITSPPFDESYLNSIKKFDKLYLAQQGSTTINGAIEGNNLKNVVIEYRSINTNICSYTDNFNSIGGFTLSGISCRQEGDNYYVLVQGSSFTSLDPGTIWPDLTSKLRLS